MVKFRYSEGESTQPVQTRSSAGLETIITIEELQVDIENRLVRIGQNYISLTATEFRILCTIMMQPSAVIRRDALLIAVCEKQTHATSRSLDVHISRLRTKLQAYGNWIRTVKGVGYRFVPSPAADPTKGTGDFLEAVNS